MNIKRTVAARDLEQEAIPLKAPTFVRTGAAQLGLLGDEGD
jgi:hypothetical protein